MKKLDLLLCDFSKLENPIEKRKAVFFFVRNIPYGTLNSHSIDDAVKNNVANCHAKAELLSLLFDKLGYRTRISVMLYRLKDFPPEVIFIPNQLDYHYVTQILISNEWINVDATYDPPLASIGFIVNDWDGKSSTPLAEKPLQQKIHGQHNAVFDKARKDFESALEKAYVQNSHQITIYQYKLNQWLAEARSQFEL